MRYAQIGNSVRGNGAAIAGYTPEGIFRFVTFEPYY